MFRKLFNKIFHRQVRIKFDPKSQTIPEAFGYPLKDYDLLVNEMTNLINPDDRLGSLETYLNNVIFAKFNLDLNNPNHAAVFGYAFCTAIILQARIQQNVAVEKVLETFYPGTTKQNVSKLSN